MKKILMFLMTLFLLAGCGKKEIEEYDYYDYPGGENVKSDYVILKELLKFICLCLSKR